MSRPRSANQGPKKIYLGSKSKDQQKNINNPDSLPSIHYKQPSNYDLKEDNFNEELYLLQSSWNELGITPEYRSVFINLAKRVSESERSDIFMQEKINLKKFRDALLNLKKEIVNRENNLTILRKLDKALETCINNESNTNSIDPILKDSINIIKTLRLNAVNIVSKIIKVNQISAYYSNSGKFDVSRIKPEYSYDPAYLFKMKNDLIFLKTSNLSTFIEMNNSEIDAFLTNCAPVSNKLGNNQKIKIPISDDLMKLITESRYALLQETVLANVDKDDIINRRNDIYFIDNRKTAERYRNNEEEKFKIHQNKPFIVNNNFKKKNNFFQSQNMSKYIYDLKNVNGANRYNNLFYNKNNNQQMNNFRLKSGKKKSLNDRNMVGSPNSNYNSYIQGKKIPIEHEFIQSLTNQQFMEKLGKYKANRSKNINNEEEQMKNEELENLKTENKNFADQIIELKKEIENVEKKLKDEEEKRENIENKYKKLSQRAKEYQNDLEEKKMKEYELNKKIEILEKEKNKYENDKKEGKKNEEEISEKIKKLENSLKNEENEKKNKEKEIEDLKKKLKKEKEEREKDRLLKREEDDRREEQKKMEQKNKDKENEEKKILEEDKKKLEDEIKKKEEIIKEKEEIIKEKEEENQKIILEKSIVDDEIIKLKNELDKLRNENDKQLEEIKELKEKNTKLKEIEEKERLKREEEEEKLKKEEEERLKKEEEERLKREEEERLKKEEEEKLKKEEEERLKKEEEERLKKEEEERLKKEEEERLKKEEEERLKKEEEERLKKERLEKEYKESSSGGEFIEDDEENKEEQKIENEDKKEEQIQNEDKKEEENTQIENKNEEQNNENIEEKKEEEKNENILKEEKSEKNNIEDDIKKELDFKNVPESEAQKQNSITPFYDYKINYYKDNISNLLNLISELIPLNNIPDFLQKAFLLNDLIYTEDYYFKGIFPKIIVSNEGDDINKIKGLCSFYYESNEDLKENLVIRINCIFAVENYEKQTSMMLDFIKKNVKFNRIEVYILYDKVDDKFIPNKEAKELFQKENGFKWLCVVRDEKQQQRYIKLYYDNENNINSNDNNILQNSFSMDSLTITTVNNEDNIYILKNRIDTKSNDNLINKKSYDKYINPNAVYSLLLGNTNITKNFKNNIKKEELLEMNQKLWRFILIENSWNLIEEEKKKIKEINFDLSGSIYKEIEKFFMTKEIKCLYDLYQIKLSLNFETNYSILIDGIYYNKISTEKIKILKEKKTNSTFFLIPSNDNTTFFYISELNKKLKEFLIDSSQNVYDKFLEFHPSTQKELFEFSVSSYRDISYIPQVIKKSSKTIYIPTFSIKSHLFSYNFKDVENKVEMTDNDSGTPSHLTSVDEFINIQFRPDINIDKSFSIIPVEDGGSDFITKDSFIIVFLIVI